MNTLGRFLLRTHTLCSRTPLYLVHPQHRGFSVMESMPTNWRQASSLIVTAQSIPDTTPHSDYKVLLLQRNKKSRFAPGNFVFPGGVVDKEDFSAAWRDVLCDMTGRTLSDVTSQLEISGYKPPIMGTDRGGGVPAEVGLRICAIRECFEESGLLLVRPAAHSSSTSNYTSLQTNIPEEALKHYQVEVSKDAGVFRELCRKYHVVPDLGGLREWGDWLTPITAAPAPSQNGPPKKPSRFDTIFFICSLDRIPVTASSTTLTDEEEIINSKWVRPNFIFTEEIHTTKIWHPQLYQFAQMSNFPSQRLLTEFYHQRAALGVERWLPVIHVCADGIFSLLPGDERYPENPNYEGGTPVIIADKTSTDLLKTWRRHHHMFMSHTGGKKLRCNIKLNLGHCSPHPIEIPGKQSKL